MKKMTYRLQLTPIYSDDERTVTLKEEARAIDYIKLEALDPLGSGCTSLLTEEEFDRMCLELKKCLIADTRTRAIAD